MENISSLVPMRTLASDRKSSNVRMMRSALSLEVLGARGSWVACSLILGMTAVAVWPSFESFRFRICTLIAELGTILPLTRGEIVAGIWFGAVYTTGYTFD